ncbi:zinc-dependent alcohol dehydrogenase [Wenzhouxiangella limi]|uniref:Zinc-binding alcohol dehydrogenase n=1 Tax=Wenzhouxiangella limi TaxID=2707351 RepID=A0A845V308_9GAMM|nr:zinc-binding alcohol dehydrogenase [Wenzhouxiangella limi]NDY95616.1 zinc-binding alcohol dehydrogenase [Wenzhouxiangella limi]
MTLTARAFWVREPGQGEIFEQELIEPDASEVRVRALCSGISRGTEALVFQGQVPPSQYAAMRAPFQEGDFPGPVKYGYASVGRVEHGPAQLQGQPVFCLFPHQDRYVVPASAVLPLPDEVPPERAVLAANAETALNVVWDAGVGPGDRVGVIGGGVVGCLVAWLAARIPGTRVTLVDLQPERAALADLLGAHFAQPAQAPEDQDVVIHTSASEAGLATALGCAGTEACVVEASWYGTAQPSAPFGEAFHARRLTLRSSQVGQLPPARRPRWDHRRRLALALALLDDPRLDTLISGQSRFDELPQLMPRLAEGSGEVLCHRIVYS